MPECLSLHPQGTILRLYIQPRSSRNQIVGLFGDRLKVKLTSPPVEGTANKCCCDYLSKVFKIPKSHIELVSGDKARQKRILLYGVQPQLVESFIIQTLSDS